MAVEVSVIIAAYNEAECIGECLDSLRRQTHPSFEVVVVDDGSTDGTGGIARQHGVRVLTGPHLGPGLARNSAVSHTSGNILVFVDADMSFHPEFLSGLTEPIKRFGVLGTFTKEEYVANWDNPWARCWTINCGLPDGRRHPADHPDTDSVFRAIRREDFLAVGGYEDMGYSEDHSLARKLGRDAVHAPGAVCCHKNPASLKDVYLSARWFGRGDQIRRDFATMLRHSLPFSLKNGLVRGVRRRSIHYPVFHIVYDFGVLIGMAQRALRPEAHAK
ncbi:MAG TPA: glycosyltransferase family 2 protein [Armatimonadota bacterium]|nr:glycosyltransferase family 2 protein [Armatimonadota bacterium]